MIFVDMSTRQPIVEVEQAMIENLFQELQKEYETELAEEQQIKETKDEQIEYIIQSLYDAIEEWYNKVATIGRQSSSSDRVLEKIITIAKSLEIVYNEPY